MGWMKIGTKPGIVAIIPLVMVIATGSLGEKIQTLPAGYNREASGSAVVDGLNNLSGSGAVSSIDGGGVPGSPAARYRIDASKSRFMVHAYAAGLLSFAAHNHNIAVRDFAGEAEATYGSVEPASLNMRVKAASLAVTDKVSDSDREKIETTMRNEVLETSKYPEIVFQSTGVVATRLDEGKYQVKIPGNLTLHGATHSVTINARLDFGTNELHAIGEFPIKQSEFGIKPVSVAGGTIKVKDEVRLSFDIIARK